MPTIYGDINPEVAGYLSKTMLKRAVPLQILEPFVSGETLPSYETKTMRFRRVEGDIAFAKANAYISEGVTPNAQDVSMTDYTLTLRQMGGLMKLTDIVENHHTTKIGRQMFEILGEQAPRIIETDRFYALRAATLKYYSGVATSRATVIAPIQKSLLSKVSRKLFQNIALQITQMATTTPDFNTVSVRRAYVVACHTDLKYDIEQIPGFKEIADYPSGTQLYPGELGSVGDFRFVLGQDMVPYPDSGAAVSGTLSTSGTLSDVYPIVIFGQRAWDSVAFKGEFAVTPIVINPNTPSHSNPMGLTGFVCWKTMQGTLITNPSWIVVAEVACTSL